MKGRTGIIAIGLAGVAVLIALCVWQVQRLAWKEGVIATLEARLAGDAAPLTTAFDPERQEFSRVRVEGVFPGVAGAHGFVDAPLLTSLRPHGPGYRVIQPFDLTDGRRVFVDRGFVPITVKNEGGAAARPVPAPKGRVAITGALRWPDEGEPGPDFGAGDNVWTNRDMAEMAALWDAEPVLIVAETSTAVGDWPLPHPLRAVDIRNNHFEYAITWGLLAIAWAMMTGWLALGRKG